MKYELLDEIIRLTNNFQLFKDFIQFVPQFSFIPTRECNLPFFKIYPEQLSVLLAKLIFQKAEKIQEASKNQF